MKKKRFSVEQIVAVLKQAELGVPVAERRPLSWLAASPLNPYLVIRIAR